MEGELEGYEALAAFFQDVADEPLKYRPTGKAATSVRKIVRGLKGPAQPQSRRNKRKARQEKRMGAAKRRRREQAQLTAEFNAARERIEKDMAEMEEAYREELEAKQIRINEISANLSPEGIELLRLIGADALAAHVEQQQATAIDPAPAQIDGQVTVDEAIADAETLARLRREGSPSIQAAEAE